MNAPRDANDGHTPADFELAMLGLSPADLKVGVNADLGAVTLTVIDGGTVECEVLINPLVATELSWRIMRAALRTVFAGGRQ
jgi:hypothetical protein